jgi:hypothetical protein
MSSTKAKGRSTIHIADSPTIAPIIMSSPWAKCKISVARMIIVMPRAIRLYMQPIASPPMMPCINCSEDIGVARDTDHVNQPYKDMVSKKLWLA